MGSIEGDIVGPRMFAATKYVARDGPYPSARQLAIKVGPHGSTKYGYPIVNRCLRKGLLSINEDLDVSNPPRRRRCGNN